MQVLLLAAAVLAAWLPPESRPWTGAILVAGLAACFPWAWARRTTGEAALLVPLGVLAAWVGIGLLTGWDRAAAVEQLALVTAVVWVAWSASRAAPPPVLVTLLGFGLALLALWAGWQVVSGLQAATAGVGHLPADLREAALYRLGTGRAFAGLGLPGHLGLLLALSLPLLLDGSRRHRWPSLAAAFLAVFGIVLTRSILAALLAGAAVVAYHWRGRPSRRLVVVAAAGALLAVVLALRGDLATLEPLSLRQENWRSALWVWSAQPLTGAGLGGFAQATQQLPFAVGNQVRHAHSLPLELLADLGLPGLIAFVGFALWLVHLARDLWSTHRALAVAVVLVPLHNLADFSIYAWGIAVPWAVLIGWGVAFRRGEAVAVQPPGRWRPLALAAAMLALGVAGLHAASADLAWRAVAAAEGSPRMAADLVRSAAALAPWRIDPLYLQTRLALDLRTPDELARAGGALARARMLRPRSATLAAMEAELDLARGDLAGGVAGAYEAAILRPGEGGVLLRRLLHASEDIR